ncbi:acyltransferase family protein [Antarctobacter heliothermus]|uniref:Peptidoglycan/LPS O-acetylase OafA/YrhL, contains acyltransferase and SGNH-hydrolase domains n=1 Tax=Antarctobacter heliothermus TaxID=74033 RepID=A0A239E262_9RHOB|nr:acyltransferase family protein [Antarctobacter heliothermus]SNS38820.1 Peptidoglycan/LPS O-acetylase OafA/YrhL, contains acyltransferase and SGNH-hydrolase domains [Antarctobacter heliothermus]
MSAPAHNSLPYRGDIDGLRAVAVLAVVLYHFGLPLQGGFVGVDIFFVISGFLIGGILWREYDATGRINLRNFYIRRFRRLAPAFFTMLLVTTALGWVILLPFEFREYGKAVIASTVYLSNLLFFRQAGYFDTASEDKPLLHTWSLAVEEQFYIFLPLLLIGLARWRWGLIGTLVACWAASLVACVLLTPVSHTAAFYLFPFRAWELLSGVLLAIWGHTRGSNWRGHPALSSVGIVMVSASIWFTPAGPLFPGLLALPPVLGTLLLLSSGTRDNPVNRMLTMPSMRFFGLISYSLYLWHWPVYTLASALRGAMGLPESLIWMALSVGLGWLSWRFVEQPVRHARHLTGRAVFGGMAVASVAALVVGFALFTRDGLPDRFGPQARVHIAASGDFLQDWSRCRIADSGPLDGLEVCPIGPDGPPRLLVWGDSHVRAMKEGLDVAAHEAEVPGLILWRAGCAPLFGLRKVESAATPAQDTACTRANKQIRQALPTLDSLDSVLLIGRWSYYATGEGVGLNAHDRIALFPTDRPTSTGTQQPQLLAKAARATVEELGRHVDHVHVLRQPPEIPLYNSRFAAREAAHAGLPLAAPAQIESSVPAAAIVLRGTLSDSPWVPLADEGRITFLDTWPYFCADGLCSAVQQGQGQYFDNNHLTNSAAIRIRHVLRPVFAPLLAEVSMHGASDG